MQTGHYCEHGPDTYSYSTCILTQYDGQWVFNVTKYSQTTSRHQSKAFGSLSKEKGIVLQDVPKGTTAADLQKLAKKQVG